MFAAELALHNVTKRAPFQQKKLRTLPRRLGFCFSGRGFFHLSIEAMATFHWPSRKYGSRSELPFPAMSSGSPVPTVLRPLFFKSPFPISSDSPEPRNVGGPFFISPSPLPNGSPEATGLCHPFFKSSFPPILQPRAHSFGASVNLSLGLNFWASTASCFKLSRPVLVGFLLLCSGPSPLLALGSVLKDFKLEIEWETEITTFQGFLKIILCFYSYFFRTLSFMGPRE